MCSFKRRVPRGSAPIRAGGRELLYAYCAEKRVPFERLGKLVVAPDAGLEGLAALEARARAAGVGDLQRLSARDVASLKHGRDTA